MRSRLPPLLVFRQPERIRIISISADSVNVRVLVQQLLLDLP